MGPALVVSVSLLEGFYLKARYKEKLEFNIIPLLFGKMNGNVHVVII